MPLVSVWAIVFPGASAERSRAMRLALLRLREGIAPDDPYAHNVPLVVARDLPCSPSTASELVIGLMRAGWLDEHGRATVSE